MKKQNMNTNMNTIAAVAYDNVLGFVCLNLGFDFTGKVDHYAPIALLGKEEPILKRLRC